MLLHFHLSLPALAPKMVWTCPLHQGRQTGSQPQLHSQKPDDSLFQFIVLNSTLQVISSLFLWPQVYHQKLTVTGLLTSRASASLDGNSTLGESDKPLRILDRFELGVTTVCLYLSEDTSLQGSIFLFLQLIIRAKISTMDNWYRKDL